MFVFKHTAFNVSTLCWAQVRPYSLILRLVHPAPLTPKLVLWNSTILRHSSFILMWIYFRFLCLKSVYIFGYEGSHFHIIHPMSSKTSKLSHSRSFDIWCQTVTVMWNHACWSCTECVFTFYFLFPCFCELVYNDCMIPWLHCSASSSFGIYLWDKKKV